MLVIQKKSVKVGKLVNTDHVNTIIRNYKQERWVHNSNRLGKEDSLSVWYSVEELEEFFAKAKDQGADGIRLYFGAYGHENSEEPLHAGRQTIVMVATRQKQTGNGMVNKDIYVKTENSTSILAYNFGSLCPPFCYGGEYGIGITIVDKGVDGLVVA